MVMGTSKKELVFTLAPFSIHKQKATR